MLADLGGILAASAIVPLAVTVSNDTQLHERTSTCFAGIRIDTDNTIYANDNAGNWNVHNTTYVTGGVPGDVYVERTINSSAGGGLTTDDIGDTRVQISTDRVLQVVSTVDGLPVSANVTVDYYDGAAGSGGGDAYYNGVTILVPMSGTDGATTQTDLSPVGHASPTFLGNAQISDAVTRYGENTLILDGTDDAVAWTDHADLSISADGGGTTEAGNFTCEVDVYWTSDPGSSKQTFVSKNNNTSSQREWLFRIDNNNLMLVLSENGSGATIQAQAAWNPAADTWYTICFEVYRLSGGAGDKVNLYVDGTLLVSSSTIASYPNPKQGSAPLRLGAWENGGVLVDEFSGHMANLRISHDFARYKSTSYTPPTDSYPTSSGGNLLDSAVYDLEAFYAVS